MSVPSVPSRSTRRAAGLAAGLVALVLPLAACGGNDTSTTPAPTDISIAPPTSVPPSSAPSTSDSPSTEESATSTKRPSASAGLDAAGAVKAAETGVADSTVVELSKDDDSGSSWEVLVRVGGSGRELQVDPGGEITGRQNESLSAVQRGNLPDVTVTDAIRTAEKRVPDGEVTEAELTRENQRTVWDVSVEVAGGDDWELWIDASSGKIVRDERD